MEVVRGRVCFYSQSAMVGQADSQLPWYEGWGRALSFSYLSYKEDVVKNGQLGDRFTA